MCKVKYHVIILLTSLHQNLALAEGSFAEDTSQLSCLKYNNLILKYKNIDQSLTT